MSKSGKKRNNHPARTQQNQIQVAAASYSGPIPPPSELAKYEELLPGSAERIIAMAEKQSNHRQDLEKITIKSGSRDSLLGLIFGLIIGLAGIGSGTYCIIKGATAAGTVIGGGSLVSLVSVFIYGSRQRRKEREAKYKN